MRISDWSSDVCSSDLIDLDLGWAITSDLTLDASMNLLDSKYGKYLTIGQLLNSIATGDPAPPGARSIGYAASGKSLLRASAFSELGRAACRERVCQYVYISVFAVTIK